MVGNKKITFSMSMTETQKEILERLLNLEYPNVNVSKSSYIWELIKRSSLSYFDDGNGVLDDYIEGKIDFSDDEILKFLVEYSNQGVK